MTDEEIEKALRYCRTVGNCRKCPCDKDGSCKSMLGEALDYINRLKQAIKMTEKMTIANKSAQTAVESCAKLFGNIKFVSLDPDIQKTANKTYLHKQICEFIHETYKSKNADYGDSFSDMFAEYGIITALARIGDKYNRIKNIYKKENRIRVKDESVKDTLLDMANYCIMTVMELESENKTQNGGK